MREPLRLTLTAAPAKYPVSLGEAKSHLRIEDNQGDDDAKIAALIAVATEHAEKFTGRAFISQTWTQYLDRWPCGGDFDGEGWYEGPETWLNGSRSPLVMPRPPLQSVSFVKVYDDNDTASTWSSDGYYVDTASQPGRIVPRTSAAFPSATRTANAIEICFIAGYGDNPHDVPEGIRQGILEVIEKLYDGCTPSEAMANKAATLLEPFRMRHL